MSTQKRIILIASVLGLPLLPACELLDPAAVHNRGPEQYCADIGDGHCPREPSGDPL